MNTLRKIKDRLSGPTMGLATTFALLFALITSFAAISQTDSDGEESVWNPGVTQITTPVSTEFGVYTPYKIPKVRAAIGKSEPAIRSDLSNVVTPRSGFSWNEYFTASDRASLLKEAVAIRPEKMGSFGQAYAGMVGEPEFVPFITTDAAMNGLRISADEAYRGAQRNYFVADLRTALASLSNSVAGRLASETSTELKESDVVLLAWIETARALLNPEIPLNETVAPVVQAELDKIAAARPAESTLFPGRTIDYGRFVPTGHYRADPELELYYQARVWLSEAGFRVRSESGSVNEREARMAFVLAHALDMDKRTGERLSNIAAVERFFVGDNADGLTPEIIAATMRAYYGFQYEGGTSYLANNESLGNLIAFIERSAPGGSTGSMTLRLLPRETSMARSLYSGIDAEQNRKGHMLAAALGSKGGTQGSDVRATLERVPAENWVKDLGWTSLYTAQAIASGVVVSDEFPRFMRGSVWNQRRVQGALGSWAAFTNEAGNVTLSDNGSASAAVEAGRSNTQVEGYVEPDPVAWSAVASHARYLREGLTSGPYGNLIGRALEEKLMDIENSAAQFAVIASVELRGVALNSEQRDLIASAPMRIAAWETYTDRSLAGSGSVITASAPVEVSGVAPATGHPVALYVIAPSPNDTGELILMRGAIYSYYETTRDREAWIAGLTGSSESAGGPYVVSASEIRPVSAKLRSVASSATGSRQNLSSSVQISLESNIVRRSSGALWYTVEAPGYDGADVVTTVVDAAGRQVFQSFPLPVENGERYDMVPVEELKSGQYFIRVTDITGRGLASGRFMVVR